MHSAPSGLLQRALIRTSPQRSPRRARSPLLLAAVFLLGGLAGRFAPRPPAAAPATEPAEAVAASGRTVRFILVAPEAGSVGVAGSWNDWQPATAPMQRDAGGRFFTELTLPPGQYEYQFVVDGQRWTADPAAVLARDDGFGRRNSVLTI